MSIGYNLITNPGFTGSETGWDIVGGWAYNNNNILYDGDAGTGSGQTFFQTINITDGNYYWVTFDLDSGPLTTGTVRVKLGDNGNQYTLDPLTTPSVGLLMKAEFSDPQDSSLGYLEFKARNVLDNVTVDNVIVRSVALTDIEFSEELITNGNFNGNAAGWTLGTNWAYNNNNVIHTTGASASISQSIGAEEVAQYFLEVDVGGSAGSIGFEIDNGVVFGSYSAGTGAMDVIIQCTPGFLSDGKIYFNPSSTFNGTLDSISVKKIIGLGGDLILQTSHLVGSNTSGNIQQLNTGKSDDSTPIYYELETQELEFNNRAMVKAITDKLGVVSQYADDSKIEIKEDDADWKAINIALGKRVNTVTLPTLKSHYLTLRWSGNTTTKSPILEGFYLNNIKDDSIG